MVVICFLFFFFRVFGGWRVWFNLGIGIFLDREVMFGNFNLVEDVRKWFIFNFSIDG